MLLALAISVSASLGVASAQSCPDKSGWKSGDDTVVIDVTQNPNGGVWTSVTGASGSSSAVNGTAGDGSTADHPRCSWSQVMRIGDDRYQVRKGWLCKLKHKRAGSVWVRMAKVKIKKPGRYGLTSTVSTRQGFYAPDWRALPGGNQITSLPGWPTL
jgi:hypothetical protein